ncbi:hypothetical protein AN641_10340 [Candidatus Epulonipiscioides gigas]|nr:hypothetical protein AN641_10185 [Epulopiscium sp. SCG-C07WGA-EpuloA2]ONI43408.1 hypothetical protein AN641_10340 [Epulopiscium sp. SCG-C07WGA-EpuloA2]
MKKSLYFLLAMTLTLSITGCGPNVSEVEDTAYPARPINAVVPFGAGGGTDVWGRALMDGMSKAFGTTITVTNVTGGSVGSTGVNQVWSAKHDGYTIACT